jgi:hypothetical protein
MRFRLVSFVMVAAASGWWLAPVAAQDSLGYGLASRVPVLCTLSGDIYAASDNPASSNTVAAGGSATVRIDLAQPGAQEIGRIGVRCNGGSATVTLASNNSFRLVTGAGGANREIPYTVTVAGTPATNIAVQTSYAESQIGINQARELFVTVGSVNFLQLAAGEYVDTLTLSVTPNS